MHTLKCYQVFLSNYHDYMVSLFLFDISYFFAQQHGFKLIIIFWGSPLSVYSKVLDSDLEISEFEL